jgi:HD-like signal output (HDOD) protein
MSDRGPSYWVHQFGRTELPVLSATVDELERLRTAAGDVSPQRVSAVVLRDPLMTFKVLKYIQERRHRRQMVEITTIAHALMMVGIDPFLARFTCQPILQSWLAHDPQSLQGALTVISRARHAGIYARDWAILRHDIEVDEVIIAALLHDLAELLLWCWAPRFARLIEKLKREQQMRSEAAQRAVLGFPLIALQLELAREWQLPKLLCGLMDVRHAATPRGLNVSLAVAVARHSANGWDDAALPDDFNSIGRLLGLTPSQARARVMRLAVEAAERENWYGLLPPGARLPDGPCYPVCEQGASSSQPSDTVSQGEGGGARAEEGR